MERTVKRPAAKEKYGAAGEAAPDGSSLYARPHSPPEEMLLSAATPAPVDQKDGERVRPEGESYWGPAAQSSSC